MPKPFFGLIFAAALLAASSVVATAQTITEYPGPSGGKPYDIARGPDQNLWFTDELVNSIVQMTTTGATTQFVVPTPGSDPDGIVTGPDGNMWFTEYNGNNVGRLTLSGTFTEFPIPQLNAGPTNITIGPDNNLWLVETSGNNIDRVTPQGVITEFPIPTPSALPAIIVTGPDGNLWFAEQNADQIGRITPSGVITEFPITTGGAAPHGIAGGFDGNLWFIEGSTNKIAQLSTSGTVLNEYSIPTAGSGTVHLHRGEDRALYFAENAVGRIGRITMAGEITEYPTPTSNSGPWALADGPDGAMWFTEENNNAIGQLFPVSNGQPLVSAVLPNSQSVTLPTAATAFATIINAGSATATSCAISPVNGIVETFSYQTANAQNQLVGTPDTPVDIPAQGVQSFVITLDPNAPFAVTTISFGFYCDNANPAAVEPGVNNFIMSASSTPVPNIIALALTPTGDGILDLPGGTGANAFAVATSNLGAAGAITVKTGTGEALLPLDLAVCETDPSTGQCLAPPSPNVTTTIDTDATPTFAVFATGTGTIGFAPAINRINVRFLDSSGNNRGQTSVAVRTQ